MADRFGHEGMIHVAFSCLLPIIPKSGLHAIRIAICTVIALSIRTLPLLTQLDKIMLPHLGSRPQCDEMTVYSPILQIQCRRPSLSRPIQTKWVQARIPETHLLYTGAFSHFLLRPPQRVDKAAVHLTTHTHTHTHNVRINEKVACLSSRYSDMQRGHAADRPLQ